MVKLSNILLNARRAERHPIETMLAGIFYASISIFLAKWVFPDHASIVLVFLTVISCLYVVQGAFIIEEKKERRASDEKKLMKQHMKILSFLMFLFIGFLIAFIFWNIVLPQELSSEIFSFQQEAVEDIRSLTGRSIMPAGSFQLILENNLRVLLFAVLFSLFYGAGAIFILVWNASVLGFVIGSISKYSLGLAHLPTIFTKYLMHGVIEMIAYFAGALAGGIIFVSLLKGDWKDGRMRKILLDTILLVLFAVVLLVVAAFVEVYISAKI